jgi:hypothetical protein
VLRRGRRNFCVVCRTVVTGMREGSKLLDVLVGVAQLVERRTVAPNVVGSNPIAHPTSLWESGLSNDRQPSWRQPKIPLGPRHFRRKLIVKLDAGPPRRNLSPASGEFFQARGTRLAAFYPNYVWHISVFIPLERDARDTQGGSSPNNILIVQRRPNCQPFCTNSRTATSRPPCVENPKMP